MNPSTLTNEELDKLIHEKIMGECWHEGVSRCRKCGAAETIGKRAQNPSYTTNPADYWRLLEKIKRNCLFNKFTWNISRKVTGRRGCYNTAFEVLLDTRKGCEAIASYF